MNKKTYKITGMDCPACATLVEMDLQDAGFKNVCCNYADSKLTVEDGTRVNEEEIKKIVKKSGYEVTNI